MKNFIYEVQVGKTTIGVTKSSWGYHFYINGKIDMEVNCNQEKVLLAYMQQIDREENLGMWC